jgi:MFS family permease
MSYFADIYGRRKTYIISWGIATLGAIGILTMQSIY